MMDAPIRVLMIVTQMNRAGIENLLMDLYRAIDRSQVQFDFYTFREEAGQFDEEILSLGGKIYYHPPISMKKLFLLSKQIKSFLCEHPEYKIVHAHMNQWCGLILKGAKAAGIPIRISHAHTSLVKRSPKNTVKNLIKCPTNRYANVKAAVSDKAGEWLYGKRAVECGEVHFWKNAIKYEVFAFSAEIRTKKREELGIENSFSLIHVGNLRHEKNHPYLFRVFAEILKKRPSSRLMLVGKDLSNGRLVELAKDLGIFDHTLFLGSRSDVSELLQAGDVFVFPSFYEGFPCSVLEAQAAGLPCVISDTITGEVKVTPLVEMRSIEEQPQCWAARILELDGTQRIDTGKMIADAGYSLTDSVARMQEFYLTEAKRIEHESR